MIHLLVKIIETLPPRRCLNDTQYYRDSSLVFGIVRVSAQRGCDKGATLSEVLLNEIPKAPVVEKPNVVIFLADTLRADYLRCYGFP